MIDLKEKYADKLRWGDFGIDYTESRENPNEHCFSLAMYWEDVETLLAEIKTNDRRYRMAQDRANNDIERLSAEHDGVKAKLRDALDGLRLEREAKDALIAEIKKIEANADYHADANVALVGDVERLTAEGANYRIALEQIRDSELAMSDIIDLATIVLEPVSTGQADE